MVKQSLLQRMQGVADMTRCWLASLLASPFELVSFSGSSTQIGHAWPALNDLELASRLERMLEVLDQGCLMLVGPDD
jgi:hypothetical protein